MTAAVPTSQLQQRFEEIRNAEVLKHLQLVDRALAWYRRHPDRDLIRSDALFALLQSIDTYDQARGDFETHAREKIRFGILDGFRQRRPRRETERLSDAQPAKTPDPASRFDRDDLWDQISPHLTRRDRQILKLRFDAGLSVLDIAFMLGIPEHHVYQHVNRSRGRLRAAFTRDELAA